jgi:hypothetical protein
MKIINPDALADIPDAPLDIAPSHPDDAVRIVGNFVNYVAVTDNSGTIIAEFRDGEGEGSALSRARTYCREHGLLVSLEDGVPAE